MLVKEKASLITIANPAYIFKQLLINNKKKTFGWDQTAHTPDHHKEAKEVKIPIKLYLQMPSPSAIMLGTMTLKESQVINSTLCLNLWCLLKWYNIHSWRAWHFFFIIQKKLDADNKGWAFNNQVRRQRTVCTLCNELKISNIFYAQWPRQICTMSTERVKHQCSKGSMAVNTPAMWELSRPCPCQTDTWNVAYLPAQTPHCPPV